MALVQVNLRLSQEMLLRVDGARGDVSRNLWIRRAVERALGPYDDDPGWAERLQRRAAMTADEVKRYGLNPPPEFYETPAPAEQPRAWHEEITQKGTPVAVSPSRPIPPRVPFRRDVKPFQRGDK